MKRVPFSKLITAFVLIACTAFYIWAAYEMHRLDDLTALAEIGDKVAVVMATALGVYVYRAKKSDDYDLALRKAIAEKELGVDIDINTNNNDTDEEAVG